MGQALIRGWALGMTAPETRGAPISKLTYHKGQAWKPDNLIVLSSRFIINIFIKLIAEKSPGLLNSGQIHLPLARLTANNSVVSEIGPKMGRCPRPHDRQIAHLCRNDMGNLESERKKKCHCLVTTTIAPLFQIVSTKLEEHERGIFCLGESWKFLLLYLWFYKSLIKGSVSVTATCFSSKEECSYYLLPKWKWNIVM